MNEFIFLDSYEKFDFLHNKNIYLYGASDDLSLIEILIDKKIFPITVFDNDIMKTQTLYAGQYPVCSHNEIKNIKFDKSSIIIINSNAYTSIQHILIQNGIPKESIMCRSSLFNYFSNDDYTLNFVDLCITQKCTLKCKACSNLMQYYGKREVYARNFNVDFIISGMENLLDKI